MLLNKRSKKAHILPLLDICRIDKWREKPEQYEERTDIGYFSLPDGYTLCRHCKRRT